MAADDLAPDPDGGGQGRGARVRRQAAGVRPIGVVAFSDSGFSVQVPTDDQAQVLAAIDRLTPQRGTSLGQGITDLARRSSRPRRRDRPTGYYTNRSPEPTPTPTPVPAGRTPRPRSSC